MSMALQIEPRTRAALHALPDDGCRHELIDGEHIVTPAPSRLHQRVVLRLYEALREHVAAHRLGELAWSPADLALGDDEVLQPDLFLVPPALMQTARWEDISALTLVAEVVSPSSARTDRQAKRLRYQRAGVPHYWIVDPEQQQVEAWHPDSAAGEVWRGRLVWPVPSEASLVIDLDALFAV